MRATWYWRRCWAGSASVAVVHAFTLGFLGNAMVGSLLQFLPVAVQARVRGGRRAAAWLYGLLNAGALLLVLALHGARFVAVLGGGISAVGSVHAVAGGVAGLMANRHPALVALGHR